MEFLTNAVGAMAFASEVFYALVKKNHFLRICLYRLYHSDCSF